MYVCMYVCMYVYVYVCMYVCMCLSMKSLRDGEKGKQAIRNRMNSVFIYKFGRMREKGGK